MDFFDYQDHSIVWIAQHRLWFLANQSLGLLRLFEKANTKNYLIIPEEVSKKIEQLFKENEKLERSVKNEIDKRRNAAN